MTKPFSVGDRVVVFGHMSNRPQAIRHVARVLKRFIELDDGSKYDSWGHEYPRHRGVWARGNHVTHAEPSHEIYVAAARACAAKPTS